METEAVCEITLTGLTQKVKVASSSSSTSGVIQNSRFILMDDMPNSPNRPKLVSLMSTHYGLAILIWERCDDKIYRWRTDINVIQGRSFKIETKMRDGSSRRTDVSIVF